MTTIRVKRGTDSQIQSGSMATGELAFATDTKRLYVYDGTSKIDVGSPDWNNPGTIGATTPNTGQFIAVGVGAAAAANAMFEVYGQGAAARSSGGSQFGITNRNKPNTSLGTTNNVYGYYGRTLSDTTTTATLNNLQGIHSDYGSDSGTAAVNSAFGMVIYPRASGGLIGNMFDLYIDAGVGTNFTNRWGIYQANTAQNYFGGQLAIGNSANKFYALTVQDKGSGILGGYSTSGVLRLSVNGAGSIVGEMAFAAYDWLNVKVTGDTNFRYLVQVDGKIEWGNGTATQDTNLYRNAANELRTDDTFNANKFKVNGTAGANFSGAVANITIVDGIVTAAS